MLIWAHLCIFITKKDILILAEGLKQGFGNTTLIAEAEYFVNFTKQEKKKF